MVRNNAIRCGTEKGAVRKVREGVFRCHRKMEKDGCRKDGEEIEYR